MVLRHFPQTGSGGIPGTHFFLEAKRWGLRERSEWETRPLAARKLA
ncbi:hypothetical protein SAMN02745702_01318 [Desulfobaculum bizertense DSM 18034]|uniref:Uncharacterized protein n=1 Tax=Desulfobaculum bizertense DSM 18034 TaxID=1121442 RepID=A0A1T4VZ48_9BACT|nr:hypothetical protein SAMN02745702_01318 [Desulfobaculum bizertense DSM 18034]